MTVQQELEAIRAQYGGILRPVDVVNFASDSATSLHSNFEWDDTEAAQKYRIYQARQIIRVTVTMIEGSEEPVRAYVSLGDDRNEVGGGYRALVEVLDDNDLYAKALAEALAEAERFRKKWHTLEALRPVFEAITRAAETLEVTA